MKYREKTLAQYLDRSCNQQELADEIGVHQSCVSAWARSDRDISVRKYRDGTVAVFETKRLGAK